MEEVEPIEVTYAMGDIAALNLMIWRWWAMIVGILGMFLILMPVAFALLDGYSAGEALAAIDWKFTLILLLCLVAWIVSVTVFVHWRRRRAGQHGPICFALSEKGISFRNRDMDGEIFWTALKSIKRWNNRLFIFVNRRTAFVIPRRAFESDVTFDRFVNVVSEKWARRHGL